MDSKSTELTDAPVEEEYLVTLKKDKKKKVSMLSSRPTTLSKKEYT